MNQINEAVWATDRIIFLAPLLCLALGLVWLIVQDIVQRSGGQSSGLRLAAAARITLIAALLAGVSAAVLWSWIGERNAEESHTVQPARYSQFFRRWLSQPPASQPVGQPEMQSAAELFVATGPYAGHNADAIPGWWGSALTIDYFGLFVALVVCGILALVTLNLLPHVEKHQIYRPELFPLLLMSAMGMMLLGFSRDLLLTFVSIELLSLPLYVLCGLNQKDPLGRESSLKYFLLGAFASGFFIYGSALLYGVTAHLNYSAIANTLSNMQDTNILAVAGVALVGVGFAFKLALVPFHAWVPDVYQGAPTPITAFMATGVKLAVAGAFIRFLIEALHTMPREYWQTGLVLFAGLSMLVGNLFALHQVSAKRLLAYSAIAHTGYLGVAFATATTSASGSLLVYLLGYVLAALGAFALISYLAPVGQDDVFLDQMHELSQRSPGSCLALAILLLSLGGFPLTAGFIGKLVVFRDAWNAGLTGLVIFALLNSVLSFYYYLRVVMAMYMKPQVPGAVTLEPRPMPMPYKWAVGAAVALTVVLGVLPGRLLDSAANCGLSSATVLTGKPLAPGVSDVSSDAGGDVQAQ